MMSILSSLSDRINNVHTGKVPTGKKRYKSNKIYVVLQNLLYSLHKYIYWAKSGIVYIERRTGIVCVTTAAQKNLSKNIAI